MSKRKIKDRTLELTGGPYDGTVINWPTHGVNPPDKLYFGYYAARNLKTMKEMCETPFQIRVHCYTALDTMIVGGALTTAPPQPIRKPYVYAGHKDEEEPSPNDLWEAS